MFQSIAGMIFLDTYIVPCLIFGSFTMAVIYVCQCDGYCDFFVTFIFISLISSELESYSYVCLAFWYYSLVSCLYPLHNFLISCVSCWSSFYQFLRVLCIESDPLYEYSSTNIFSDILTAINFVYSTICHTKKSDL